MNAELLSFRRVIKGLKIELTRTPENLPSPLFAKEGLFLPLQREVWRDFINQFHHYYETVNKAGHKNRDELICFGHDSALTPQPSPARGEGGSGRKVFCKGR